MTPERKAACRVGWVAMWGVLAGELLFTLMQMVHPAVGMLGFMAAAITLVIFEPTIYRWVTAPERDTPTQDDTAL